MTGPEHYALAEALVARSGEVEGETRSHILSRAQVHATLALVAAQAEPWLFDVSDRTGAYVNAGWVEAVS